MLKFIFFFKSIFADDEKYFKTASPSDNFPVIVGGPLGASVIIIIGIVLVLFVIRYAL